MLSFWHFFWAALKHKLDPSLLIFQWKKQRERLSQTFIQWLWHWHCTRDTYTQIPGLNDKKQNLPLLSSRSLSKCSTSRPWDQDGAAALVCLHRRVFNYLYKVVWSQQETETVPPKPDHRMMCQHLFVSNHVHTKIMFDETQFSYQMNCVAELTDPFQTTAITLTGIHFRSHQGPAQASLAMLALLRASWHFVSETLLLKDEWVAQ